MTRRRSCGGVCRRRARRVRSRFARPRPGWLRAEHDVVVLRARSARGPRTTTSSVRPACPGVGSDVRPLDARPVCDPAQPSGYPPGAPYRAYSRDLLHTQRVVSGTLFFPRGGGVGEYRGDGTATNGRGYPAGSGLGRVGLRLLGSRRWPSTAAKPPKSGSCVQASAPWGPASRPRLRGPEPAKPVTPIAAPDVVPPALPDYAELCA
jgi:hypothetical protein